MDESNRISSWVRASITYPPLVSSDGGEMVLTAEDMVDIDRLRLNRTSSASKIGDGGGESSSSSFDRSELERSSSSTSSPL